MRANRTNLSANLIVFAIVLILLNYSLAAVPLPTIKQYLDAMNQARTNPKAFATFITTEFKAKVPAGSQVHSVWRIGFSETCPEVFDEAINYMNTVTAIGALTVDLGMTYAAWKQAKWIVESNGGSLSHSGPGGNSVADRLGEYTSKSVGFWGENILYLGSGYGTGQVMVSQYLIDDGVSSRGHRLNIMKPEYAKIGIGLYPNKANTYFYQATDFSNAYTCDKCGIITCQMQKDCGWSQYLADAGLKDPCVVTQTSGSGTSPATTPATSPGTIAGAPSNTSTTKPTVVPPTTNTTSQSKRGGLIEGTATILVICLLANLLQ
jgi:uncharacterized protein YkwD